jgi:hypothetical protein
MGQFEKRRQTFVWKAEENEDFSLTHIDSLKLPMK